MRERRLGDLVAAHRALVAEVAALDADRQMLVYENYSKFIAATDTIKQLNGEVAGLDGRIRSLDGLIGARAGRAGLCRGVVVWRRGSRRARATYCAVPRN